MCSPSSSSIIRTVPCVAGWEGPNCRRICSPGSSLLHTTLLRPAGVVGLRAGVGLDWLLMALIVILTQRMTDELVVQIDPAQIGMAAKINPVQIVGFALQPIRAGPHADHRINRRIRFGNTTFDAQARHRGG